jgi:hypothetical protein
MSMEGTTSWSLFPTRENILLLLLLLLLLLYSGNHVKEVEMSGACGKNGVKAKCIKSFLGET